jgi:hypothetical protein
MSFSKNNILSAGWLHPVLLVLYFITSVWYDSGRSAWGEIGLTLLITSGVVGLFWLFFALLAGPGARNASIPATLLALVLLNATYLQFSILHESVRFRITFPVVVGILGLLSFYFRKKQLNLGRIHLYFNLVILASGAWLGWKWINFPQHILTIPEVKVARAGEKDVYLLVMDAYAAPHNLKKYWHHGNTAFTDSLKRRGFRVFPHAHSNYNMTQRTLGSMLNLSYLNSLEETRSTEKLLEYIPDNLTTKLFRQQGFRTGWFTLLQEYPGDTRPGTTFLPISYLTYAASRSAAYFVPAVYARIPGAIDEPLEPRFRRLMQRAADFERFVKEPATGRRFGYYHSVFSHPTYVVNARGFDPNIRSVPEMQAYGGTLPFSEQHMLGVVNTILSTGRPSIIVILSDHGYRGIQQIPREEAIREGFENFLCVYETGGVGADWYEAITPVNVWRKVINHEFGSGLPMLEDRYGIR